MTRIRVTIDTDESDKYLSEMGSLERGVYGCDNEGVYHMWYGSRSDLCTFHDVEILDKEPDASVQWHDENCAECKAEHEE